MNRVFALWHGGPNYAHPELDQRETFSSITAAVDVMRDRMENRDGQTPCVTESSMFLYRTDPATADDPYPFLLLEEGPRGGIRRTRA